MANFGQVIFEILEQAEKPDEEALPYLFQDMAEVNMSAESEVLRTQTLTDPMLLGHFEQLLGPGKVFIATLVGRQRVAPNKRPDEPKKLVQMSMALFRFKEQEADFLVSVNTELEDPSNSATADQITDFFNEVVANVKLPSREAFLALFPS